MVRRLELLSGRNDCNGFDNNTIPNYCCYFGSARATGRSKIRGYYYRCDYTNDPLMPRKAINEIDNTHRSNNINHDEDNAVDREKSIFLRLSVVIIIYKHCTYRRFEKQRDNVIIMT